MQPGALPDRAGAVVARNVAWLGAGELISRIIGFSATIFIARTLGAEAYGIVGLGLAILLYGTTLIDAGLEHTGPREVTDAGAALPDLVSSLLLARILWATVVSAAVVAAAFILLSGVERTVLAVYGVALLPIGAYTRWVHVGLQRTAIVSAARVGADVLRVLTIFLLVRGPADLVIIPLAEVGSALVAAAVMFVGVLHAGVRLPLRFDARLTRAVVRRAAPMAVSALLATMIYNADLVFLRVFRDSAEIGLYLAGYTLINFLGPLGHVTALGLVPALARLRDSGAPFNGLFHDSLARAFAAGLPMAVGGALTAPLLIAFVFGSEYAPSAVVLRILIWVLPVVLLRSVFQAALLARGRQDLVLRTTLIAAGSNIALNFIAVPLFGMTGAAVTTLVAETLRLGAAWVFARREALPLPDAGRFAASTAAAALMAGVLLGVRPQSVWLALPLGVVSYTAVLALTGALRMRGRALEVSL